MPKQDDKKLDRIIDANFNRAKEGLRVCEDVCRFFLDDTYSTRKCKDLRHRLTKIMSSLKLDKIIKDRDIDNDVGKLSTGDELKRNNVSDIFYANSQRVKESVRVLEEVTKLKKKTEMVKELKLLRYQFYAFEKRIAEKF